MTLAGMFLGAFFAILLGDPLERLLKARRLVDPNYLGVPIPRVSGILFLSAFILSFPFLAMTGMGPEGYWFALAVTGMALVGLADDVLGGSGPRGWKGHMGALARGRITTGGLKALAGASIGVVVSLPYSDTLPVLFLNALGFALLSNSINLLDVRPGRALKGFYLGYILLTLWQGPVLAPFVAPLLSGSLVYAGQDLRGSAMMGDVGSAALGAALGFMFIQGPLAGKVAMLVILILYHYVAERYSLTRIIKGVPWLHWADRLGVTAGKP